MVGCTKARSCGAGRWLAIRLTQSQVEKNDLIVLPAGVYHRCVAEISETSVPRVVLRAPPWCVRLALYADRDRFTLDDTGWSH